MDSSEIYSIRSNKKKHEITIRYHPDMIKDEIPEMFEKNLSVVTDYVRKQIIESIGKASVS